FSIRFFLIVLPRVKVSLRFVKRTTSTILMLRLKCGENQ
ncbi:alpha amylase, N-terminal ig-like domain protein, partial [Vibrio parahaemolyticus V-223/04]